VSVAAISFRKPVLAWAVSPEDEARFSRIKNTVLIASALVCLLLLWLPRPVEDRAQVQELPPQLARLVLEREVAPSPPPPAFLPRFWA
jgi:periplasmic protein TonB